MRKFANSFFSSGTFKFFDDGTLLLNWLGSIEKKHMKLIKQISFSVGDKKRGYSREQDIPRYFDMKLMHEEISSLEKYARRKAERDRVEKARQAAYQARMIEEHRGGRSFEQDEIFACKFGPAPGTNGGRIRCVNKRIQHLQHCTTIGGRFPETAHERYVRFMCED